MRLHIVTIVWPTILEDKFFGLDNKDKLFYIFFMKPSGHTEI